MGNKNLENSRKDFSKSCRLVTISKKPCCSYNLRHATPNQNPRRKFKMYDLIIRGALVVDPLNKIKEALQST